MSTLKPNFFLETVSPEVRRLLVKERIRAMKGELEEALNSIEAYIKLSDQNNHHVVALGSLWAELLHNNLEDNKALNIMDNFVTPRLKHLRPEERFSAEQNRSDILLYIKGGVKDFYNIVDRKRLLRFEWLDYRELFHAKQDAGQRTETLSILWQQNRRAYLHNCWMAQRIVAQIFANECIQQKKWEDAVHHFILAQDDSLVGRIAIGVLEFRNQDMIARIVKRLVSTANLRTDFVLACKLVRELEDGIPDQSIGILSEWLFKRAKEEGDISLRATHFSDAWKTIEKVGKQFTRKFAKEIIELAINHQVWNLQFDNPTSFSRGREEMVRAIIPLIPNISNEMRKKLAMATIPLVKERRQIPDHADSINLLCRIAHYGGKRIKELIGNALYESGQVNDRGLFQVANVFGKGESFGLSDLNNLAVQVIEDIRNQVQFVNENNEIKPVLETKMQYSDPDNKLVVFIAGEVGLHALIKNWEKLDKKNVKGLLHSILEMLENKYNFCSNKSKLLFALVKIGKPIPIRIRKKTISLLERMVDRIETFWEYPTDEQVRNKYGHSVGDTHRPEDVQAMSLIALASLAFSKNSKSTKRLYQILEEKLSDHQPKIRRAAYSAAQYLPEVPSGVIIGVLAGLREPDPAVASNAFHALTEQKNWNLNENHWRVFLMAVHLTISTCSHNLRKHAAKALVTLASKCPKKFEKKKRELLENISKDISWSVRT